MAYMKQLLKTRSKYYALLVYIQGGRMARVRQEFLCERLPLNKTYLDFKIFQ